MLATTKAKTSIEYMPVPRGLVELGDDYDIARTETLPEAIRSGDLSPIEVLGASMDTHELELANTDHSHCSLVEEESGIYGFCDDQRNFFHDETFVVALQGIRKSIANFRRVSDQQASNGLDLGRIDVNVPPRIWYSPANCKFVMLTDVHRIRAHVSKSGAAKRLIVGRNATESDITVSRNYIRNPIRNLSSKLQLRQEV